MLPLTGKRLEPIITAVGFDSEPRLVRIANSRV
jgi:hypothetical protein